MSGLMSFEQATLGDIESRLSGHTPLRDEPAIDVSELKFKARIEALNQAIRHRSGADGIVHAVSIVADAQVFYDFLLRGR